MADDNKPLKYMKYAIGEIVLVVIGILIALQINTWNEQKKTDGIVQNYYSQILKDVEKDSVYIQDEILRLDHNAKLYKNHLEIIKEEDLDSSRLLNSFLNLDYRTRYYTFNSNTIETLESTGDIKLIPSQIRNMLINLKRMEDNRIEVNQGNIKEVNSLMHDAASLGYSELYGIKHLQNGINQNYLDVVLKLHTAHRLKNSTEDESLRIFKFMLSEIDSISSAIKNNLQK